jgi:hypothetical protein
LTQDVYQPNLEKRHHQLKSVHDAAPVTLKSPARIEALFACQFIALLCCCLIDANYATRWATNRSPTSRSTPKTAPQPPPECSTTSPSSIMCGATKAISTGVERHLSSG